MIKKTVKYTDYEGVEREEDFYFNLTKAEITMMELEQTGGLIRTLTKIMEAQDSKKMIEYFKDLVLRAYGVKSPDGKRFVKTQEVKEDFEFTEAFSEIFMELAFDAEAAANFVNGIMPDMPNVEKVDPNASPEELQKRLRELEAANREAQNKY